MLFWLTVVICLLAAILEQRLTLKDRKKPFERKNIHLNDLEQYTRRTNIEVENIPFSDSETNSQLLIELKSNFSWQEIVLEDRDTVSPSGQAPSERYSRKTCVHRFSTQV